MGDLVFIDVAKRKKAVSVQEAWDAYIAAQERAKETLDFDDGVAAGKAWAAWLELFAGRSA